MIRSDSIKAIAGALVKAQTEMENAIINRENSHFHSKFADLPSVREAILGPLNANGISLTQIPSLTEQGSFELTTLMMHAPSGEYIGGNYPLPSNGRPQEIGSAITYARRYMAAAMAFVAADEDDDGNAGQAATPPVVRPSATAAAKQVVNDDKPAVWQVPAELGFDGNYVEWGTRFAERLKLARNSDEISAWFLKNATTLTAAEAKAPRVYARLMTLGGESGKPTTKADQEKTDARATGTAKSATDGLEVFRLALMAATTDAEVDQACQVAKLPKSLIDQAAQMAEARRKQIAVTA